MYPQFHIKRYAKELIRPWKLATFSLALAYYIWGAYYYQCPTWDVPVSLIMSLLTYIFAPWTVKSIYYLAKNRPRYWLLRLIVCAAVIYACASGSYELYNWWNLGYHPPPTYWINLYYSTLMFFAAGMVWKFEGTLRELIREVMASVGKEDRV